MRTIPNFVLRSATEQLEEAQEWLTTIHAPEKKELHDNTPIAVAYWIDRAKEIVFEVTAALNAFDLDSEDDTLSPESFRFKGPADVQEAALEEKRDRMYTLRGREGSDGGLTEGELAELKRLESELGQAVPEA